MRKRATRTPRPLTWAALAASATLASIWLFSSGTFVRVFDVNKGFLHLVLSEGTFTLQWLAPGPAADLLRDINHDDTIVHRVRSLPTVDLSERLLAHSWAFAVSTNQVRVRCPMWTPLLLVSSITALLWARDRRAHRPGSCSHCGYDRRGLAPTAACPECGTQKLPL